MTRCAECNQTKCNPDTCPGWATTVSGRTPSQPKPQNIPVRTPEGKRIRDAFPKVVTGIDCGDLELKLTLVGPWK